MPEDACFGGGVEELLEGVGEIPGVDGEGEGTMELHGVDVEPVEGVAMGEGEADQKNGDGDRYRQGGKFGEGWEPSFGERGGGIGVEDGAKHPKREEGGGGEERLAFEAAGDGEGNAGENVRPGFFESGWVKEEVSRRQKRRERPDVPLGPAKGIQQEGGIEPEEAGGEQRGGLRISEAAESEHEAGGGEFEECVDRQHGPEDTIESG